MGDLCNFSKNSEVEIVDEHRYLGVKFSRDSSGKTEVKCRVMQGRTVRDALKALVNEKKKN